MQLVRFELDNGGSVLVEVDRDAGVERAGRAGKVLDDVQRSFANALADVRDAASVAIDQFRAMATRPDKVEIKFGVQFDAEAGAVIARTGVAGNFEVTVSWRGSLKDDDDASPDT